MNIRRIQFTLFSFLVSTVSFGYLFSKIDATDVIDIISNSIPSWLGLFVVFSLSMSTFRTWRYQVLLLSSGYGTGTAPLFLITLVRNFFSDLLPARLGTLIYIYLVRSRLNIPLPPALSSFSYAFIFDILSLSLLVVPALIFTGLPAQSSAVIFIAGFGMLIASVVIIVSLPRVTHAAAQICNLLTLLPVQWRNRLHAGLIATEKHLAAVQNTGMYWRVIMLSFGVRVCKYVSLYALLLGLVIPLGYTVSEFPFAKVFLGLTSAELASSLPISGIAGFGAYEGTWALVFQLLGYPEKTALLTGISHHLITQLYGYGLGGLALLFLLLPVFKNQSNKKPENSSSYIFLLKFSGMVLLLIFSVILLVPVDGDSSATSPKIHDSTLLPDVPVGEIVFEGPGGIYLQIFPKGNPKLITRDGTWPRRSPDGRSVAFVRNNSIMLIDLENLEEKKIAHADSARAVCFTAGGGAVLFTDGLYVRQADLQSQKTTTILTGEKFLEIDSSDDGKIITATVKTLLGFKVRIYKYPELAGNDVAWGCSASLSPDGLYVTVNSQDHRKLHVFSTGTLKREFFIPAPGEKGFDNQFWSNQLNWLVSTSDGNHNDIFVHNVRDGTSRQATSGGHFDRADMFIPD